MNYTIITHDIHKNMFDCVHARTCARLRVCACVCACARTRVLVEAPLRRGPRVCVCVCACARTYMCAVCMPYLWDQCIALVFVHTMHVPVYMCMLYARVTMRACVGNCIIRERITGMTQTCTLFEIMWLNTTLWMQHNMHKAVSHIKMYVSSGMCYFVLLRHRLNGYLAQWVPSPPGKHTCNKHYNSNKS